MGIYIKGVNLPSECTDCSFGYQSIYCKAMPSLSPEWEIDGVKPDWCPLVEVKGPHGKLIDSDALKQTLIPMWNCNSDSDFANKCVWHALEDAPTVIESEDD